jgi:hypothetical protein
MIDMTPLEIAQFWQRTYIDKNTKTIRNSQKWFGHCWIWKGHKKKGYGDYSHHQKHYRAHRIAFFLVYGKFEYSLLICHRCDNPSCVNPQHLFVGTSKENTQDMISKKRMNPAKGENKGVTYRKETEKWRARYMRNYQNVLIGEFRTKEEAVAALKKARNTP